MCDEEVHPGPGFLPVLQESTWHQQNRLQQLYHYALAAERVRMTQNQQHPLHHRPQPITNSERTIMPCSYRGIPPNHLFAGSPHHLFPQANSEVSGYMALLHAQHQSRLMHQMHEAVTEPKPQQSYIGLIAMAILSSPERKLVLSDIYQHILEHHPYFRRRGPGWRNSIRHNLSLNDCFVKSGRSANGKGHYWAIHPANVEDFRRGDFRRRRAQRKVRRHMGLVADDEPDSPSPPPVVEEAREGVGRGHGEEVRASAQTAPLVWRRRNKARKRQFDVESLLAPDEEVRDDEDAEVDVEIVTDVRDDGRMSCWSGPSLAMQGATGDRCNGLSVAAYQTQPERAIGGDLGAMPNPSRGPAAAEIRDGVKFF